MHRSRSSSKQLLNRIQKYTFHYITFRWSVETMADGLLLSVTYKEFMCRILANAIAVIISHCRLRTSIIYFLPWSWASLFSVCHALVGDQKIMLSFHLSFSFPGTQTPRLNLTSPTRNLLMRSNSFKDLLWMILKSENKLVRFLRI